METLTENIWQKSKWLVKGVIIGVMALLLLIPAYFVENLIMERETRQKEAVTEVSSKWAGRQLLRGPVLVIPYHETVTGKDGQQSFIRRTAFLAPDKLDIKSVVNPEQKTRGIYKVMLYSANVNMSGRFSSLHLAELKLDPGSIIWKDITLSLGIMDHRGLRDDVKLDWNGSPQTLDVGTDINTLHRGDFVAPLVIDSMTAGQAFNFKVTVSLNGSEQLLFVPTAKETTLEMKSAWPDPSFTGSQLPDTSWITDKGFTARWKTVSHAGTVPLNPNSTLASMESYAYGADLYIQLNGYQKTLRSVKYAILCILLTFTAFFLIETSTKQSVHPLHYALIGCALLLFYTLLLSFSEYTGFNMAYMIAAIATTSLIAWFVRGLLKSTRPAVLLSVILVMLYSYVFTILQLQDYALLLGSVGLFLTLGVVMYFTRKLKW